MVTVCLGGWYLVWFLSLGEWLCVLRLMVPRNSGLICLMVVVVVAGGDGVVESAKGFFFASGRPISDISCAFE